MIKDDPLQAGLHSVFAKLPGFRQQLERIFGAPHYWIGLHSALLQDNPELDHCGTLLREELSNAHYMASQHPVHDPFENDVIKGRIVAAQLTWENFVNSTKPE